MGNAYTGVASDYSALYWNPAGLAQIEHGEFSIGLSHLNFGDASTFFNASESYTNNSTSLNTLGLAHPLPVRRGSFVIAFGFARQSEFTTGVSFAGFNPYSSIIQKWAPNGRPYPPDITIAEELKLAVADTVTGRFVSPIIGSVTQVGRVLEGGGINNWSAGAGVQIGRNVSVGATVTYLAGSYTYDRNYKEQDNNAIYSSFPFDFDELVVDENVSSDISGVNGKFGLLYSVPERFRFGMGVRTPTVYHVTEDFGTTASSYFDNGDVFPTNGPFEDLGSGEYDVVTPWVFTAGASVMLRDLVLSGDVEYTDWTQLEFDDANLDLIALNKDIKEIFRPTANLRAGMEYEFPGSGVRVRGGFMYNPSPYEQDVSSSFDQKYITGGLGILLGGSTMLDLAYARGWWDTDRINYEAPFIGGSSRVSEEITTNNFILTLSYRF
jgi:long-subunit fatty acid transport protein